MTTTDWLSRLLELAPASGRLEVRCLYGAPWHVVYEQSAPGEIPYHVVVAGSAVVDDPDGGPPQVLRAGDVVLLPHGSAHKLHDGSGARPVRTRDRTARNLIISENAGSGERLDMLCGRFMLAPQNDRLMRAYLPARLIVRAGGADAEESAPPAAAQLARLVAVMRQESTTNSLGGDAMLRALSAALFALVLRLASEMHDAPAGLMALAGAPRLAPALEAMIHNPQQNWTLPRLAELCNMSRATLARQFGDRLGCSASSLLTDIRMTLAATELCKPGGSTERVAEAVGYQSVAAFKRAFKQHTGKTPADWRRTIGAALA
jgi:AraC family transcriptional activator of mtrCDE